jgi:predicted CxxxxCH...CXXCH cytochrome family protein
VLPFFQAGACTIACHDRGGARPKPSWSDSAPMTCNDCHGSPPPGHYAGACTSCHAEANAEGTALTGKTLHMNGRVDRGDGSGACGACHGKGDDPWPSTGAHAKHRAPTASRAVACETCHEMPDPARHPRGGGVTVKLAGGGVYASGTCTSVRCHGAGLIGTTDAMPRWNDPASGACGTCHALPPGPPHHPGTTCSLGHRESAELHVNGGKD